MNPTASAVATQVATAVMTMIRVLFESTLSSSLTPLCIAVDSRSDGNIFSNRATHKTNLTFRVKFNGTTVIAPDIIQNCTHLQGNGFKQFKYLNLPHIQNYEHT